jgi:hypothetical protein
MAAPMALLTGYANIVLANTRMQPTTGAGRDR